MVAVVAASWLQVAPALPLLPGAETLLATVDIATLDGLVGITQLLLPPIDITYNQNVTVVSGAVVQYGVLSPLDCAAVASGLRDHPHLTAWLPLSRRCRPPPTASHGRSPIRCFTPQVRVRRAPPSRS